MGQVSEMVEVQERLYFLRDELARRPAPQRAGKKAVAPQITLAERRLQQLEAGLYPTCEVCGERIEIYRLHEDALTPTCQTCARTQP